MLRTILAITGKPGLFKIISHSNRMLLVEDITSGKRTPVHSRDKVVSLGDIAMYTEGDDKPLAEILDLVHEHTGGEVIDVKSMDNDELRAKFAEILPDYDHDRVYPSDIKKLFTWYNLLLNAGYTKFTDDKEDKEDKEEAASSTEA